MSAKIVYITTLKVCRAAVDRLSSETEVALGVEGTNLGRNGTISLIQLYSQTQNTVFLFDIWSLGGKTALSNGGSGSSNNNKEGGNLRTILESDKIQKIVFDVRSSADALFHLFDCRLKNVFDIQILFSTRFESYSDNLRGFTKVLTLLGQTSSFRGSLVDTGENNGIAKSRNRRDERDRRNEEIRRLSKIGAEFAVRISSQDQRFRVAGEEIVSKEKWREEKLEKENLEKGNSDKRKGNSVKKKSAGKDNAKNNSAKISGVWDARPMQEVLMRYAASNVHYLCQMKRKWGDAKSGGNGRSN
jgi:hypothetical protein